MLQCEAKFHIRHAGTDSLDDIGDGKIYHKILMGMLVRLQYLLIEYRE